MQTLTVYYSDNKLLEEFKTDNLDNLKHYNIIFAYNDDISGLRLEVVPLS